MYATPPRIPDEYIVPLNMNGLRGRMLRMPAPKNKKREMLIAYGHHASLERWYGFAEAMNDYAGITMPDFPGFGGMDSFYKIGEKPNLDTMADYLASIIKLRFKNRRFTIVGVSYGFLVATRMLQNYPEIAKKVDMVISVAGFAHHEDFLFSKRRMFMYRMITKICSTRLFSTLFRNIALHPAVIRSVYHRTHNAKHKFDGYSDEAKKALTDFEVVLWRGNDTRTHIYTNHEFLYVNNCHKTIDLPVYHIGVEADHYFNNRVVEQHMRVIFNDFLMIPAPLDRHVPNILADKKDAAQLLTPKIRRLLNKKV